VTAILILVEDLKERLGIVMQELFNWNPVASALPVLEGRKLVREEQLVESGQHYHALLPLADLVVHPLDAIHNTLERCYLVVTDWSSHLAARWGD
jgi:hypothetical protein